MDENKDDGSEKEQDETEEEELESYELDEEEPETEIDAGDIGGGDEEDKDPSEVIDETFESRDPRDMMKSEDSSLGSRRGDDTDDADEDTGVDTPVGDDSVEEAEASDLGDESVEEEPGSLTDTDEETDLDAGEPGVGDADEEASEATDESPLDTGAEETDEAVGVGLGDAEDVEVGPDLGDGDADDVGEEVRADADAAVESEVEVEADAGTGEGAAGLAGVKQEELDEAVEQATDISEFFGGRESGGESVGEISGFFEPEEDLEDTFGDDKLQVLLSEAKQGVAEFEDVEGFVEHERYWVNKPYAYVAILYSDAENDYRYWVVEPQLDDFEEAVRRDLEERLRDVLMYEDIDDEMAEDEVLEEKTKRIINDYGIDIDSDSMHKILYYLKRDYVYDGKIDPIMRDPHIEDISCDGDNVPIFVYHRNYRDLMTNVEFTREELESYVIKLAQKSGKHISVADPLVDASMPDGSRVQMSLGKEVTDRGSTFTIRKFKDEPFTPIDLIKFGTFSLEQMAYLWTCIENNKSLIFAGGTASGKTTSMNAVTLFIPPKSKVVSIEDTREVTLPHMNWIPSVTRDSFTDDGSGSVDMYELLRAALRQRPEYLVVGEVRGEEALTLFQAMSTGHTTYSTMHADSVDSAIHRLENPPISVPRSMLKALDIVSIQTQTFVGGERVRRNMKLVEIIGIDPKTRNIRTDDIFQWDAETDSFIRTGNSTALQEIKRSRGWSDEELERQLDMRREVLQYLLDRDIDAYEEVSKTIQSFIIDPDRILNQIREDELDMEALEDLDTLNI